MKKVLLILLLLLSITLFACNIEEPSAKLSANFPETIYVNDVFKIEVESSYINDYYYIDNLSPEYLDIDDNFNAKALKAGKAYLIITSSCNGELNLEIEILPLKKPTSIDFNIEGNNFITGVEYNVNVNIYPIDVDQTYIINTGNINNVLSEDNKKIVFNEAGKYTLVAFSKVDRTISKTLEIEVDFNPEIECYQVLYIGNSLTNYTFSIPAYIQALMINANIPYTYTFDAPSGFSLDDHSDDFFDYVNNNRYTHIVFQEKSNGSYTEYDRFVNALNEFISAIPYKNTKTVLYQTWAYEREYMGGRDEQKVMHDSIVDAYNMAKEEVGADLIVRAGEAFFDYFELQEECKQSDMCTIELPSLYIDANHPNSYGAFLSACVHYVTYTGRKASENNYVPLGMDEEVIKVLKEIADKYIVAK